MITRTYTKTVAAEKLKIEINTVYPDLIDDVNTSIDEAQVETVKLILSREPTPVEDAALTDMVNNHVPSYMNYKIWDMVVSKSPAHTSPIDINFNLLPLAIKKTYKKGEEDVFTYYKTAVVEADGSITYSDPILRTTWSWTHDPVQFPVYAQELIEYYYADDTIGPAQKIIPHYFDGLDKIRKGKAVRSIQIESLQIPVSEMIIYNETVRRAGEEADPEYQLTLVELDTALQIGRDFMSDHQSDFANFIAHKDLTIVTTVTNGTEAFLDWVNPYNAPNTIRDYILAELAP